MSTTALTKSNQTAIAVKQMLDKNQNGIIKAMPAGSNYERFVRTVVNAISTTPALASCDPTSITRACIKAFSVGIEPNGPTQEGYLVPFGGQAQFLPSYRGLIALAVRSGLVNSIQAFLIHANDTYKVQFGLEQKLEHIPAFGKDRGDVIAVYVIAKLKNGETMFDVMDKSEVEAVRQMSKSKDGDAWRKSWGEMAKKTAIKRIVKSLPVSVENLAFAKAINMDNAAEAGTDDGIIDIDGIDLSSDDSKKSIFEKQRKIESSSTAMEQAQPGETQTDGSPIDYQPV